MLSMMTKKTRGKKTQWHIEETLRGAISAAAVYLQQRYSDRPLYQRAGEDDDEGEEEKMVKWCFCVRVLPSKCAGMCLRRHNEQERSNAIIEALNGTEGTSNTIATADESTMAPWQLPTTN